MRSPGIFLLLPVLLLFSCESDQERSMDDLKARLQTVHLDLQSALEDLEEGDGMRVYRAFEEVMTASMSSGQKRGSLDMPSFLPNIVLPTGIDEVAGTFTWDASATQWNYIAGYPADEVHYFYPAEGPLGTENDCQLVIREYEDARINMGGSVELRPAVLDAYIMEDDQLQCTFELSATYTTDTIPDSMDLLTFLSPMNIDYKYEPVNSRSSDVVYEMTQAEQKVLEMDARLTFAVQTDSIVGFDGTILMVDVLMRGSMNLEDLMDLQVPSQLNDFHDIAFYTYPGDEKIADLYLSINQDMSFEPLLLFTDGSIEPASDYFDPVVEVFETFFRDMGLFVMPY